jgi:hypothetical protein
MLRTIKSVRVEPKWSLRLTFADGVEGVVRLDELVRSGGVFASLAAPAVFEQVKVGPGGRFVEWPGEIDLCADALWREIHDT